jgi:hypothetical protein
MLYTARLSYVPPDYVADCVEIDATGQGRTRGAAIDSLRAELADRVGHVEGMAPPARTTQVEIEILVIEEEASHGHMA